MPAGKHLFQVTNEGEQRHELVVTRLGEGATMDDVYAYLQSGEPPQAHRRWFRWAALACCDPAAPWT